MGALRAQGWVMAYGRHLPMKLVPASAQSTHVAVNWTAAHAMNATQKKHPEARLRYKDVHQSSF